MARHEQRNVQEGVLDPIASAPEVVELAQEVEEREEDQEREECERGRSVDLPSKIASDRPHRRGHSLKPRVLRHRNRNAITPSITACSTHQPISNRTLPCAIHAWTIPWRLLYTMYAKTAKIRFTDRLARGLTNASGIASSARLSATSGRPIRHMSSARSSRFVDGSSSRVDFIFGLRPLRAPPRRATGCAARSGRTRPPDTRRCPGRRRTGGRSGAPRSGRRSPRIR